MIKVITIEREYGAGGGSIAKALASELGWSLCDESITRDIAARLHCDVATVEQREERCDGTMYRLMKAFMRGSYEDRTGANVEILDADHLATMFEHIVTQTADKGNCVIVGRGAPWFLRNRQDTFNLFVYAPAEEKIRRICASGRSRAEAEDLIERVDRERASFIKRYYNKSWPQRDLYHLMVNSKVGEDAVIHLALREIELLNARSVAHA